MTTERVTVSGVSQSWDEESLPARAYRERKLDSQPVCSRESGLRYQEEPANRAVRAISPDFGVATIPFRTKRPSTNVEALAVESRPAFCEKKSCLSSSGVEAKRGGPLPKVAIAGKLETTSTTSPAVSQAISHDSLQFLQPLWRAERQRIAGSKMLVLGTILNRLFQREIR
jgi:hypothetical protein